jgi:hypothetical protein
MPDGVSDTVVGTEIPLAAVPEGLLYQSTGTGTRTNNPAPTDNPAPYN